MTSDGYNGIKKIRKVYVRARQDKVRLGAGTGFLRGSAIWSETGMKKRNQLYEEWKKENVGSEMGRAKVLGLE